MNTDAMSGRWERELTPPELKQVMNSKDLEIVEWPLNDLTYVLSATHLAIIRTGSLGGDVRDIHGGWKYPHHLAFMLDRREIKMLPEGVTVRKEKNGHQ